MAVAVHGRLEIFYQAPLPCQQDPVSVPIASTPSLSEAGRAGHGRIEAQKPEKLPERDDKSPGFG